MSDKQGRLIIDRIDRNAYIVVRVKRPGIVSERYSIVRNDLGSWNVSRAGRFLAQGFALFESALLFILEST